MKIFLTFLIFVLGNEAFGKTDNNIINHLKQNTPTVIYKIKGFKLDPILQEKPENIYLTRLYFTTPLLLDEEDKMSSSVLQKFTYSWEDTAVVLQLKPEAKFGDGTKMKPSDIAVTIKRLMLSNKNQLSFIKGSHKLVSIDDEIEGLRITSPDTLKVFFNEPIANSLSWLTHWELGIVKSEYVKKDGSLYGVPPSSGKWSISEQSDNLLKLSNNGNSLAIVDIDRSEVSNYINYIGTNHVIIQDPSITSDKTITALSTHLHRFNQVGNRISYLALDPKNEIFKDKRVRQYLAQEVRKYIGSTGTRPHGSIVPSSEKEYTPLKKLKELIRPFEKSEEDSILKVLKSRPIIMRNVNPMCFTRVKHTLEKLGATLIPGENPDIKCFSSGVPRGEALSALYNFLSLGKVPALKPFVENKALVSILNSDMDRTKKINKLNRHLFENSVIAVTSHSGVAYFTSKKTNVRKDLDKIDSINDLFFD